MKTQDNITKFLIRNSLVTYTSTVITIVTLVLFFLRGNNAMEESREYLYVIKENGEIVPMEWINRRDNIKVEIKHHLQMFVDNFYNLDQFTWEDKVERSLWLGDVEKHHAYREKNGYYNKFVQWNSIQKAKLPTKDIEISHLDNDTYDFKIIITINIDSKVYNLFSRGKIRTVNRNFPHNPHGLWIYEYIEEQTIEQENS